MLCSRNNKLKTELPLLMEFTNARCHDSKNFLYAIDDFERNGFGLSPKELSASIPPMITSRPTGSWNTGASMRSSTSMDGPRLPKTHQMISLSIRKDIPSAGQGMR